MLAMNLSAWRFPVLLAALLALLLAAFPVRFGGDLLEYTLDTVALASHGTPEIRLDDIARAKALLPQFAEAYGLLEQDMRAGVDKVYPAFVRGREGLVYPIHFFGYPAMAALPFRVFEALGLPPFKAFQVVNLAAVFVLGLALRRFFASEWKALAGVALFMLCGGWLYWNWSSPECVSAAALLAGLLLFASGAPVAGAMLAGLAGQQNPTILFFFGFAPLLLVAQGASLKQALGRRNLLGLAAGAAVYALPMLFNFYQYGVPNIIANRFSDPSLVGAERLASFYFDLNQGMILAIPGVLALLLAWSRDRQRAALAALCAVFTLALALPALAVLNWNSGAAGVMRYAFWAAMPFVFALLLCLRERERWHAGALAALVAVQGAAMAHASSYDYVEFSPLARAVLARAPAYYHPEPEIFAERAGRHDNYIFPDHAYRYAPDGVAIKTLVHAGRDELVCGRGARLAPGNRVTPASRGWLYLDAPVRCLDDGLPRQRLSGADFGQPGALRLADGWSVLERHGQGWDGVWSSGARSRLLLAAAPGLRPAALALEGHYLEGNQRTRVIVNGADLGWHRLDREATVVLPPELAGARALEIELEHQAPRSPGAGDGRLLALFLTGVSLRGEPGLDNAKALR